MKIVINDCHGGFGLSNEGIEHYANLIGVELVEHDTQYAFGTKWKLQDREIPRDDPALIKTVETLGKKADGNFARLKIVDIPDDVEWQIDEYDGLEWVAEQHRTWS